jgi:hypothetical protein
MIYVSVLFLILALSFPHAAKGADYTISLNGDTFEVELKLNAFQNLTSFQGFTPGTPVFPSNLTTSLQGADLSAFTASLQNAVKAKVSTVSVSQPSVHISSNSPTYTCPQNSPCPLQWLNVTVQFTTHQTPDMTAGAARYDLPWKSIHISDDLQVNGASYNRLGEKYFLQALLPFLDFPPQVSRSMVVRIAGLPITNRTYVPRTTDVVLLDMSLFETPVEEWTLSRDLFAGTQTWTSPRIGGFQALAVLAIAEPEGNFQQAYFAAVDIHAQITAPLGTSAKGDTLLVDTSGGLWEKLGSAAILGSLGVFAGTVVIERRIKAAFRIRQKKEKR